MLKFLFLIILLTPFSSYAVDVESNTCYIKWSSIEEKEKVEAETLASKKAEKGYVRNKLENDQIKVSMKVDDEKYLAILGHAEAGRTYIKLSKTIKSFAKDALHEVPVKDLKELLEGFEKTDCEHMKKED